MEWLDKVRQKIQPLPQSPYAQALNGGLDLEAGLRRNLNKPLMNAMPYQQFNPTLMQGKNLIAEVMPGIGDAKAIADAQDPNMPGWLKALNYASVAPGIGDVARLGGNMAMPLMGAMTAFHGSPHKFSQFDMSKIGTGEGAQAYGHGLYFAESPGVAKTYKTSNPDAAEDKLIYSDRGEQRLSDGGDFTMRYAFEHLRAAGNDYKKAMKSVKASDDVYKDEVGEWISAWENAGTKASEAGSLYEVDIPDTAIDKMLDWDKPLSEQPESVRKALGATNKIQELDKLKKRHREISDWMQDTFNKYADENSKSFSDAIANAPDNVKAEFKKLAVESRGLGGQISQQTVTGESIYTEIAKERGQQAASEYLNSLGIAFASTLLTLAVGLPMDYGIARAPVR